MRPWPTSRPGSGHRRGQRGGQGAGGCIREPPRRQDRGQRQGQEPRPRADTSSTWAGPTTSRTTPGASSRSRAHTSDGGVTANGGYSGPAMTAAWLDGSGTSMGSGTLTAFVDRRQRAASTTGCCSAVGAVGDGGTMPAASRWLSADGGVDTLPVKEWASKDGKTSPVGFIDNFNTNYVDPQRGLPADQRPRGAIPEPRADLRPAVQDERLPAQVAGDRGHGGAVQPERSARRAARARSRTAGPIPTPARRSWSPLASTARTAATPVDRHRRSTQGAANQPLGVSVDRQRHHRQPGD